MIGSRHSSEALRGKAATRLNLHSLGKIVVSKPTVSVTPISAALPPKLTQASGDVENQRSKGCAGLCRPGHHQLGLAYSEEIESGNLDKITPWPCKMCNRIKQFFLCKDTALVFSGALAGGTLLWTFNHFYYPA